MNRIAVAFIWASLMLAAAPAIAGNKIDAWVFKQHSCSLGDFIVTAAPHALRIDALSQETDFSLPNFKSKFLHL